MSHKLIILLILALAPQAHAINSTQTKRIDRLERKLDNLQSTLNQFLTEQHERSEKLSKLKSCYSDCRAKFEIKDNEPDYIDKDRRACYESCTDRYEPKDFIGE